MAKIFKAARSKQAKVLRNAPVKTVKIDAHDHAGNGISLASQPIMIVENAIEGETCRVKITKQTKRVQFANVIEVLDKSDKRKQAFCEYYAKCGGCTLQHLSARDGLQFKSTAFKSYLSKQVDLGDTQANMWQADVLSDIDYQDTAHEISAPRSAYRRRIRLAVDARHNQIKLGFRAKASNEVVNIASCAIASNAINSALVILSTQLPSMPNIKSLGHIVITEGDRHCEIALFVTQALSKKTQLWLMQLAQLAQVNIVVKQQSNCLIRLDKNGNEHEHILSVEGGKASSLEIDSDQFLQVNQAVNVQMLERARAWLNPNQDDILFDFFCGAGNFALYMANYVNSVCAFEGLNSLVQSARNNAKKQSLYNCDFRHFDLADQKSLVSLELPQDALVILDPSREGAKALCEYFLTKKVQKIVYVSCNPNSFVRDTNILLNAYRLEKVCVLDMFPFTKHIEVMGLFIRQ